MSRFLFILQYDSFIKTLLPVIDKLSGKHNVDLYLLQRSFKKSWIDDNIIALMGERGYEIGKNKNLYRRILSDYDVIVIGSVGARFIVELRSFLTRHHLSSRIASGYVGALLKNHPTGFYKGVMRRSFTDLIWTPGTESRSRILNTGFVNTDRTEVVPTGLPRFDTLFQRSKTWQRKPETILYIEQPTFPASREERLALVNQLAAVANAYPDRKVVIKPRFNSKTGHAHPPKFLLPDLLEELKERPTNLIVSTGDLYTEFRRTDFALSISSTGALEAMLVGIPTYFIKDFCGETNRYGSSDFNISGNVVTFDMVINKQLPPVDFTKADTIMRFDGHNTDRLIEAMLALAKKPKRWNRETPLKVRFQYPHGSIGEAFSQQLKHTHERHDEVIALWINQSVSPCWLKKRADLNLTIKSEADNPASSFKPPTTIKFYAYFVSGTLMNTFPQKQAADGSPVAWDIDDFAHLETAVMKLKTWLRHDANRQTLQNLWSDRDLISGEFSFSLDKQKLHHISPAYASIPTSFSVSAKLRIHLEQLRSSHEEAFDSLYTLLDRIAWFDRFFETIAHRSSL